jgi:hypothetical protein
MPIHRAFSTATKFIFPIANATIIAITAPRSSEARRRKLNGMSRTTRSAVTKGIAARIKFDG